MPFVEATYAFTNLVLCAGSPSSTKCTGFERRRIIRRSSETNASAFSPPWEVQYQKPPRAFTAEAALIDCRWPGRSPAVA